VDNKSNSTLKLKKCKQYMQEGKMLYYQARIRTAALALDVRVNDLPVFENDGSRGGGSTGGVINDSIIDGHNTVSVRVRPAQGQTLPSPSGVVVVEINRVLPPDAPKPVYEFEWKVRDIHAPLPTETGGFESGTHFGTLAWQRAAPVALDAATEAGVWAQVHQLHEAMAAKDAARMTAILAVKAHDKAIISGLPPEEFLADQERYFQDMFSRPGWEMEPVSAADCQYRLYGNGRVVGVKDKQGRDVIRSGSHTDGGVSTISVFVSLLNDQWVIVR